MSEMGNRTCIVTGANSGIGKETALALARMGMRVVMAVRNRERGDKARDEIVFETANQQVTVMICDVSSMHSIRQFAGEFRDRSERLDVLLNNAGVSMGRRENSVDGYEMTIATNYLGPVLLTNELLPLLRSSAPSRVINVGSGLYRSGRTDLDALQAQTGYSGMKAYADSKMMLLLYTYKLARLPEGTGVTVNAVLPGFVATNLGRGNGLASLGFRLMRPFQISAKKSAEALVYLAASKDLEGVTGKCFSKSRETTTTSITYDQQAQERLWEATTRLLEIHP
jgi:NAD(P)-dependent dehydrogenase (short-subunit alcohol dehydrogenase family)